MRIVIFLQKPKWNSIFGMVGNAVSLSDRWSFREIYMWEAVSARHGKRKRDFVTTMSYFAQPEIVLITLWSNQWVSTAEVNLFGTKTDLTQKYLWRKIFWKDCEQTLRKNIFLWMMGLSIVLASVHIEENERKISFSSLYECFNISQPTSISAFPWISLLWDWDGLSPGENRRSHKYPEKGESWNWSFSKDCFYFCTVRRMGYLISVCSAWIWFYFQICKGKWSWLVIQPA